MTVAEQRLWSGLRDGQLAGFAFRRRHAVGAFTVDFICLERGLVVEMDGPAHGGHLHEDFEQQRGLEAAGWRVLRFTHGQVFEDLDWVLGAIGLALEVPGRREAGPRRGTGQALARD